MKIVLIFLLITGVYAKSGKWKNIEPFNKHSANAYQLKEDIDVLEIRAYGIRSKYKTYHTSIGIYVKPKKELSKKLVKKFSKATLNSSRKGDIRIPPDFKGNISRGFILYKNGKIFRMNEMSDIISCLGEIDTAAEAQLVLWLHSQYSGVKQTAKGKLSYRPAVLNQKYRKTEKGYEIVTKYTISHSYSRSKWEWCNDEQNFTDRAIIDKRGKIVGFKQLSKSKIKSECSEVVCHSLPEPAS